MSTRKLPFAESSQPPKTPSRYAPSTPHTIRALQQRRSAKTRSVRTQKTTQNQVQPHSHRGVLRLLAKKLAPATKKRVVTPAGLDKENISPENDKLEAVSTAKNPVFSLNIEESLEPLIDDDGDSELLVAPTPSVLPDDEDGDPTLTFKGFEFARIARAESEKIDRRKARVSFAAFGDVEARSDADEDEPTVLTEIGRRAVSEEPTGHFSRYSFGSIRMSDFGTELEVRSESDEQGQKLVRGADDDGALVFEDEQVDLGGETEDLRRLMRFGSQHNDRTMQIPDMEDIDFELQFPGEADEENGIAARRRQDQMLKIDDGVLQGSIPDADLINGPSAGGASVIQSASHLTDSARRRTFLEQASTTVSQTSQRKRVRLTRHGTAVPSLPTSLIKRIATETQTSLGKRKPKLGRDQMKALEQATEWFFEQAAEDLAAFSDHAGRKKRIIGNDMLMLIKRQRILTGDNELLKLAEQWLPKDVLDGIELPENL